MKKLLLLMCVLLTGVSGAWAQTTVTIANCPNFTKGTASATMPSAYGSFSSKVYTTTAASGIAGVIIDGSALSDFTEAYVNVSYYGDCVKIQTAAASTDYKITLTAPAGYMLTGYSFCGSANTAKSPHTITSENGLVEAVITSPPYNSTPQSYKEFSVTGLNTKSTFFTIQTKNYTDDYQTTPNPSNTAGNILYIPVFKVYLKPIIARPSARVTSVSAGVPYLIYNAQYKEDDGANEPRSGFVGVDGTSMVKPLNISPSTFRNYGGASVWQLETTATAGEYYAKNLGTDLYYKVGTLESAASQAISFTSFGSAAAGEDSGSRNHDGTINATPTSDTQLWEIKNIEQTGNNLYWNGNRSAFATWSTSHPYAVYSIDFISPIYALSEINTAKTYNITTKRGWWAVANDGTEVNSTNSSGLNLATSYSDAKQQFAFVSIDDKYYLFSINVNKFVYVDGTKLSFSSELTDYVLASPVTLATSDHAVTKGTYPMLIKLNDKIFGVHPSKTPTVYNYQDTSDEGNSTAIVEAANLPDASSLAIKKAKYKYDYLIAAGNLDKPGFPTSAGKTAFEAAIDAISSLDDFDTDAATALTTYKATVVYPNGRYYIKNRNTGCYAFVTDDGEPLPRIKIDNSESHTNNNYLWYVTSDKTAGTCSIVSSLYSSVPFAKGANNYSEVTSSNRTVVTTLSTEVFSSNNGKSGGFYLNGAHNNNTYNSAGNGNSHVVSWNTPSSAGSQWIFEPEDLGTAYTATVAGIVEDGGMEDAVTLSDGTILNLGTGTVYLNETPTDENITQNAVSGYSILDGSIAIDTENHIITITYSPSYSVLCSNFISDNDISAKLDIADNLSYPKSTTTSYENLNTLVNTTFADGSHEYSASDYSNLKSYYDAYLAETDVVKPSSGNFYRIKSSANWSYANMYLIGANDGTSYTCDIDGNAGSSSNSFWYYNGTTLYGYGNGGYPVINNNNFLSVATATGATGTSISFQKANKSEWGAFNVIFKGNGNTNRFLYTSDGYTDAASGTDASYGYNFNVEEVTSLPVTITAAKYATLCAPVALTIPSGVKAYYISNVTKTEATLTKLTGTIPADMPVILYADGLSETTTFNFPITTADAFVGTNILSGQTAAQNVAAGFAYTLQTASNEDLTVGFYPKAAGIIAGFRAYLLASALPAGVKGLKFRFDDADGISTVQGSELMVNDTEIYNIAGQRISKLQKGVNIVNGKKVLVK